MAFGGGDRAEPYAAGPTTPLILYYFAGADNLGATGDFAAFSTTFQGSTFYQVVS